MLRSVTGYLNEQIVRLVTEIDRQVEDVSFHWVDVSQIYESNVGAATGCVPVIHGLTV